MKQKQKKIFLCIVCIEVLGVVIGIMDCLSEQILFDNTLERGEAEEGVRTEEMKVQWESGEEVVEVTVSPQELTKERRQELFCAARKEIDHTFPGANDSLNEVRSDVIVRDAYQGGVVRAVWEFDNYQVVDADGILETTGLSPDGTIVTATVSLTYLSYEERYQFSFCVYPPAEGSREGVLADICEAVTQADRAAADAAVMKLPDRIGNTTLVWQKTSSHRGLQICLLGILAAAAMALGDHYQSRLNKEILKKEKLRDYPEIVSQLSLLMGAGISLKGSMQRIVLQYERRKEAAFGRTQAGFEEVRRTFHEMEAGVGEMEALSHFGRHGGLKEYRKLSLLLEQNLRKGTRELSLMLEKEEQEAFVLRKQLAKKTGEEASTKLLIPMVGMLFLVIVVLITPALMAVQ